jgi:hypothetical protein
MAHFLLDAVAQIRKSTAGPDTPAPRHLLLKAAASS